MKVTVQHFARCRDITHCDEESFDLREGSTVATLEAMVLQSHPALGSLLTCSRPAVNEEYCDLSRVLHDGDRAAFIPPVSGG